MRNYIGDRTQFPALGVGVVDDGDLENAVNFNTTDQGQLDGMMWNYARGLFQRGLNYPYNSGIYFDVTGTVTAGMSCICWDAFNQKWRSLSASSGSLGLSESSDHGVKWAASPGGFLVTSGNHAFGLVANPAANLLLVMQGGIGYFFNGTAWTAATTNPLATTFVPTASIWFAGLAIFIGGDTGVSKMTSSPTGVTFTDRSAQVPAGLAGTTNWLVAASPTIVIAAANLGNNRVTMTSADGITWAAGSMANASLLGSDLLTGLTYSAADGLFMAIFSGTGVAKVMKSPDGVTWTFVRSITIACALGLSVCDRVWTTLTGVSLATAKRSMFSIDRGLTWSLGPATLIPDTSVNKDVLTTIASPTATMIVNSSQTICSLASAIPPTF